MDIQFCDITWLNILQLNISKKHPLQKALWQI